MVVAPSDCMEHLKGTGCSKKTSKLRWNHMFLLPNNFASRIQTLANDNQTLNGGMTRSHQQFTNYKNVLNNEQEVVPYTAALGECGEQEKTEKQTHRILSSHIEWYDHVIAVAFLKCLVSELMRFMGVDGSDMIRRCSHCVSIAWSGIRGKFIRNHHFWTAQLRRNMFFLAISARQFPQWKSAFLSIFAACSMNLTLIRMREPWSAIKVGSDAWKNTTEGENATYRLYEDQRRSTKTAKGCRCRLFFFW